MKDIYKGIYMQISQNMGSSKWVIKTLKRVLVQRRGQGRSLSEISRQTLISGSARSRMAWKLRGAHRLHAKGAVFNGS